MFFEARIDPTPSALVPDDWGLIADSFHEGSIQDAAQFLKDLLDDPETPTVPPPHVSLLKGDIYRALGQENLFREEIQSAVKARPNHWELRIQWARIRTMQNRLLAAERDLLLLESELGEQDHKRAQLILSLKASLYAQWGRGGKARECIKNHAGHGELDDPLSNYEIGCAHFALRDWSQALNLFLAVQVKCPKWPRPRIFAYHCLNALGRTKEAQQLLESAVAEFAEDVNILLVLFGHLYSTKDYKSLVTIASKRSLDQCSPIKEEDSDKHRPYLMARGLTVRALWHIGEFDKAIASAALLSEVWASELKTKNRQGRKKRLPIKPLVQDKNMCVPACIAMILRTIDPPRALDPQVIFKEMEGSAGVSPWQLDRWLFRNKLYPIDISVTVEAVRGMLDAGFPLLATRSKILMCHQELIVGYDDSLEELEVIEPTSGVPIYIPYDQLSENYSQAGESFVALVPMTDPKNIRYPGRWVDAAGMTARRILRSVFTGNIVGAQKLFSEIKEKSLIKSQLELRYPDIFVPHPELPGRLKDLLKRDDADTASRFQTAMLLLETSEKTFAKRVLADLRTTLPGFLKRYLIILNARSKGQWLRMKHACQVMLERSASLADLWFFYSVSLHGTGEYDAAEEACKICLEIDPSHLGANLHRLSLPSQHIPLEDQQRKVQALLHYHPRSEALRGIAAQLAFDFGQPETCLKLLKESARLFPHSPTSLLPLRDFFLIQERPDLAPEFGIDEDTQERSPSGSAVANVPMASEDISSLLRLARAEIWDQPGPAMTELRARQLQAILTPAEDLELREIELQFAIRDATKNNTNPSIEAILPASLPAPKASNLDRLLGGLPLEHVSRHLACQILDWSAQVMEGEEWTPYSKSLSAFLEERAGRTANAARIYEALAGRYNLIHANYRLGIIHCEQERFREAITFFEKCIQDKPAHIGAWESLAEIHAQFNDLEPLMKAVETIIQLLPYDPFRAQVFLELKVEHDKTWEARAWLDENGGRYPASFREWWQVKLHMSAGRFGNALESIGPALRAETPREAFAFEMEIYSEQGRLGDHQDLIREALDQFPDDILFNHYLASVFEHDPAQVLEIYAANFKKSPSAPIALEILKRLDESLILDTFEGLAVDCASEGVPVIIYDAFTSVGLRELCVDLFERLERQQPENPIIVQLLSENYRVLGLVRKNRLKIEQLLALDPENPGYIWLCGLGLLDYQPTQARELFLKHYQLTGDPEALAYLGRCEQLIGHAEAAREAYWRSLEDRKGDPWVTSNLYRLGDRTAALLSQFRLAFNNPPDPGLQGFAVTAVEMALEMGMTLPSAWENWAIARVQGLSDARNAIPEEATNLELMLYVWCKQRGRMTVYQDLYKQSQSAVKRRLSLFLKTWWWTKSWVPTQ
jgi:tetratricopeptide (TPR) repeat protein